MPRESGVEELGGKPPAMTSVHRGRAHFRVNLADRQDHKMSERVKISTRINKTDGEKSNRQESREIIRMSYTIEFIRSNIEDDMGESNRPGNFRCIP